VKKQYLSIREAMLMITLINGGGAEFLTALRKANMAEYYEETIS
jgi:hypothetical protein